MATSRPMVRPQARLAHKEGAAPRRGGPQAPACERADALRIAPHHVGSKMPSIAVECIDSSSPRTKSSKPKGRPQAIQ